MSIPLPDNAIELLARMVQIPSVNASVNPEPRPEAALARYNQSVAQAMGFDTRWLPVPDQADNLLITFQVAPALPWLMFDSHLDTVGTQGMTIAPFDATLQDQKLWGRGACDTKGTGAAMLWAMYEYAHQQTQPLNIALLMSVDEEYGMTGIRSFFDRDYDTLGFEPIGVIVGEPTLCQPIVAHNGSVRLKLTTRGVAAHSSDPSRGQSAISAMCRVIQVLESQYIPRLDAHHPLTGKAQGSINLIQGGQQINIIADQCEIQMDRRLVPGEQPGEILPTIHKVLRQHLPEVDYTIQELFTCPPLSPRADAPLLDATQKVLTDAQCDAAPHGVAYCTHGGDWREHGIDTLVIGPGDIAQAHTQDEWIALDQLQQGVHIYRSLMQTFSVK